MNNSKLNQNQKFFILKLFIVYSDCPNKDFVSVTEDEKLNL
jgi:hypothetical protein